MVLNIIFAFILVIGSCSTDKNPLPGVSHPEGWNTEGAENAHSIKVPESGYTSCKSCHGNDLNGGKTQTSCFTCHLKDHPKDGWVLIDVSNNHSTYIETSSDSTEFCKGCHGDDLKGGVDGVSCFNCHAVGSLP